VDSSIPRWLVDLVAYSIGVVIVIVIFAWLRTLWRERDRPDHHGER
jgi:hypothetical protein